MYFSNFIPLKKGKKGLFNRGGGGGGGGPAELK